MYLIKKAANRNWWEGPVNVNDCRLWINCWL